MFKKILIKLNFILTFAKNKYPACDGRCVQNLSTSSPKRADFQITRDSNFIQTSYSLQSENEIFYRFTLNCFIVLLFVKIIVAHA